MWRQFSSSRSNQCVVFNVKTSMEYVSQSTYILNVSKNGLFKYIMNVVEASDHSQIERNNHQRCHWSFYEVNIPIASLYS